MVYVLCTDFFCIVRSVLFVELFIFLFALVDVRSIAIMHFINNINGSRHYHKKILLSIINVILMCFISN